MQYSLDLSGVSAPLGTAPEGAPQALLEALAALPPLAYSPAPWGLAAKPRFRVDAGDTNIRQAGGSVEQRQGNARLITAAPVLYWRAENSLISLVIARSQGYDAPEIVETIQLLIETIAWIHEDPLEGAGLLAAAGVERVPVELRAVYRVTKRGRR